MNIKTAKLIIGLNLLLSFQALAQEWECQNCPKRSVARFDLDVQISETDWQAMDKPMADYSDLYFIAGGAFNALFNDDPSRSCIRFTEGTLDKQIMEGLDTKTVGVGNDHVSLPPPAGSLNSNYLLSGSVVRKGGKKVMIQLVVMVSETGEVIAEAELPYDFDKSGLQNGQLAGEQLMPLMGKIRDFERSKRETDPMIVIGFDGNQSGEIEIIPDKDKLKAMESMQVKFRVTDCDQVAVSGMELHVSAAAGTLKPPSPTTDGNGEAIVTYTAPCDPGQYAITAKFNYRWPFDAPGPVNDQTSFYETEKTVQVEPGDRFHMMYKHSLTQDYAGQFLLKSEGEGVIVCTIDWEANPPAVNGVGMAVAPWTGNADQCVFKGRSSFKVTYEGTIVTDDDGSKWLEIKKTDEMDMGGKFTIDCAGYIQEVPGGLPFPVQEDDRVLRFELKHGATNSYDVPNSDTHYSYTLDMGCK